MANEIGSAAIKNISSHSMKFPKPRILSKNEYKELNISHPNLMHKLINEIIYPNESSPRGKYIQASIDKLKEQAKKKNKKIKINQLFVNRKLYFMNICFPHKENFDGNIHCLVDTGAANSLIHSSIVHELKIPFEPCQMTICTATGTDAHSIKGIAHVKVKIKTTRKKIIQTCVNFIVTEKLNGLQCIIGADFLMDNEYVAGISGDNLIWRTPSESHRIRIADEAETHRLEKVNIYSEDKNKEYIQDVHECVVCTDPKQLLTNYSQNISNPIPPPPDPEHTTAPVNPTQPQQNTAENEMENGIKTQITEENQQKVFSHSIKEQFDNETLPEADMLFEDSQELKEEILTKKITLNDGDYSQCPPQFLTPLMDLLENFKDRFSESKLDLEITDMYTADLDTLPHKIVNQKCRRIPTDRAIFAEKAIKQLMDMGVVSESDSEWRSNVVMVPKPQSGELRTNTKSDMLDKNKKTELWRICLDFRELNTVLLFPKQVQFVNLENLLHKLKNKFVVSMDISSAFFIIPIREQDRHKTAFWVNDLAFEFNCLVMGLKSSPYHLKMFMNLVFSIAQFEKLKTRLSEEERQLLPASFADMVISYFDDCFVYADTYEQLLICFKLCLMAAREAKIKFSMEKTTFFTTKIKVLGYTFDTKEAALTMDKLKSSAILNMKRPSSLYELHSRLCAFQYQAVFIPYLKHILYPLHFLLRKREWSWGDIEEEAWTLAKQLCSLGLKLTIPDQTDDLVLTTDASKVAASACLFRVKNGQLELVAVNSKYFNVTDLNKCSYVLESIALAYGLKAYASYILNCTGTVRIFTDARSLIYCKRNTTHSILLNSTLNYLINFVTLSNIELYHLPGEINVLADIMSRAIADNLNCALNREHPISKQWAAVIPPIPDNFSVDRNTLFKFLTTPLKQEIQDTHDRRMRKLAEPKSVQEWFDVAKGATSEERFYNALRLLEQWNFDYDKAKSTRHTTCMALSTREQRVREAHLTLIAEKNKACAEKIEQILEKMYNDIKNTPIYRKVRNSLVEASKQMIRLQSKGTTEDSVNNYVELINEIFKDMETLVERANLPSSTQTEPQVIKALFSNQLGVTHIQPLEEGVIGKIVTHIYTEQSEWELKENQKYKPYVDGSALIILMQEDREIKPNEIQKFDLNIRVKIGKGSHVALIKHENIDRLNLLLNTDLLNVDTDEYMRISIQNIGSEKITIREGTPVVKLVIYPSSINTKGYTSFPTHKNEKITDIENQRPLHELEIPKLEPIKVAWTQSSTDQNISKISNTLGMLDPYFIKISNIKINILGNRDKRTEQIDDLRALENELLLKSTVSFERKLPCLHTECTKTEEKEDTNMYKQAQLAHDLLNHKKLSVETLISMQTEDENISKIRENLVGNPNAYPSFMLKNGIVCRKFTKNREAITYIGIYVPKSILHSVMLYIHRKNLHTSVHQTYKEFLANYYHPQANKIARAVCHDCVICTQTRNLEKKQLTVGKARTLKPEKPREGISADILYFPRSTAGYQYGLLVADLYSLYISFYPMKTKNSMEVAKHFRAYFSAQGVPKSIYTDSDQSFRGETETLFRTYGIKHVTSYPYTQKENPVESQVRIFKNAYRAAIQESDIFKIQQWEKLYPIVICRINALISKYGMSREAVHFGTIVDSSLPLITDTELFNPLEDDLKQLTERFRDKIGKFLMKRKRNKELYRIGKQKKFYMYELVMKINYTPDSMLTEVCTGPYRIIHLDQGGARLKDIKTGEEQAVSFEHMRKIKLDELLALLPQNFDSEIMGALETYRYKRGTTHTQEQTEAATESDPKLSRQLRSGKLYTVSIKELPGNTKPEAEKAYWRKDKITKRTFSGQGTPTIIHRHEPKREFQIIERQTSLASLFNIETLGGDDFKFNNNDHELNRYKGYHKSSYASPEKGTLIIKLKPSIAERNSTRVKFKDITVHFY